MRKLLCLLLAFAAFSASSIAFVFTQVNNQRDQVTITETVVSGDKAAAEGLTILSRNSYINRLHWDTTYVIGDSPITDTAYRFTTKYEPDHWDGDHPNGLYLSTNVDGTFVQGDESPTGLAIAYKELYDSMKPGEEKEIEVYLKDYYDYYPISGMVELPGLMLHLETGDFHRDYMTESEAACVDALQNFFRIPILDDDKEIISLGVDENKNIWSTGGGSISGDDFYLDLRAPYTDDAIYMVFDAHSNNDTLVDTSLIPGGFGIYRLPYHETELPDESGNSMALALDQMANVYPLDPRSYINGMILSETGEELLLFTCEMGIYYLTVIDIASMETLQKLELTRHGEPSVWGLRLFTGDGFLAFTFRNDTILVVAERQKDGTYTLEFSVPLTIGQDGTPYDGHYLSGRAVMAYDGEKLAIADLLEEEYAGTSGEHYWSAWTCGFYTAVYDATGMVYFGTYDSSLSAGENYNDHFSECTPKNNPFSLRWS